MVAAVSIAVSCAGHSTKHDPPAKPSPVPPLFPAEVVWRHTLDLDQSAVVASTADRTRVYLPLDDQLLALDRDTGEISWTAKVVTPWSVEPFGDSAYVLTRTGLVELDAATGAVRQQHELPASPSAAMTRSGDVLLIPVAPQNLLAWQLRDSRILWNQRLPAPAQLPVVMNGDRVLAALSDGRLTALRVEDGAESWTTTLTGTPRALGASPTVAAVGTSDRALYVLNRATGALKWHWSLVADIVGMAIDEKHIYVAGLDNNVRAFNPAHGAQQWKAVVETRLTLPPQLTSAGLLIAGNDSVLTMLSTASGTKVGTYALKDASTPGLPLLGLPPLVFSDRDAEKDKERVAAVLVTRDGRIVGIRPKPPAPAPKPGDAKPGETARPLDSPTPADTSKPATTTEGAR
jgi:outer membrane protein assembly factor BamB